MLCSRNWYRLIQLERPSLSAPISFFWLNIHFRFSESCTFQIFSSSQLRAVWPTANALGGVTSCHSSAGPLLSLLCSRSKYSVVIYFSYAHAPCGYSSFRHDTHTVYMAFSQSLVYIKTQIKFFFSFNLSLNHTSHIIIKRIEIWGVRRSDVRYDVVVEIF